MMYVTTRWRRNLENVSGTAEVTAFSARGGAQQKQKEVSENRAEAEGRSNSNLYISWIQV
jgi:hypothetical protein